MEEGGGCAAPCDITNLKVIMGVRSSYIDYGVLETDMGC